MKDLENKGSFMKLESNLRQAASLGIANNYRRKITLRYDVQRRHCDNVT